jgi:hypothetical protein
LPQTLEGLSPSGSKHLYFEWPEGLTIRNSASELAPGIDVRGEGGMVIAPPSVRSGVGVYRWITNVAPAKAPAWLLQLIQDSAAGDPVKQAPNPNLEGPIEEIAAALAVIPNDDAPWETPDGGISWNSVGMAVFAASRGNNEGLGLFDHWSQKSSKYDNQTTLKKWLAYFTSPPTRIGFGSLVYWADQADPDWRDHIREPKSEPEPLSPDDLDEWDAGELLSGSLPPPRQWLIYRYFCRKFVSSVVAPGNVGKTTLRLTQAIELATGRELLGQRIRCRVLVLSFEDDRDELHRRLLAICKHHNINPADLKGWLFCKELNGPKLAKAGLRGELIVGPLDGMVRRAISRCDYGLVILDPFVKLHVLAENDNPQMDFVASLLVKIAHDLNVAIDSPAHTHKGVIVAGDADARRGASSQTNADRLDYTFTAMTEEEAKRFGILPDERKSYVRLDNAKVNIVRSMKASWFRLVSIPLGNPTEKYPDGDHVQAIERWHPPETWEGISSETLNAILDDLDKGMPDGRRYSRHGAATDRAAWQVVHQHCPDKTEAQCREIIKLWWDGKVLVEDSYDDTVTRKKEIKGCASTQANGPNGTSQHDRAWRAHHHTAQGCRGRTIRREWYERAR